MLIKYKSGDEDMPDSHKIIISAHEEGSEIYGALIECNDDDQLDVAIGVINEAVGVLVHLTDNSVVIDDKRRGD